jgi:hypothetical protein
LFGFFEKHFLLFERAKTHNDRGKRRKSYELVLFGYNRGGHEFIKVFKSLGKKLLY